MTGAPIHATAVAIGGRAVLILGRSGAGKSDLALRLIDRGAMLVSDDYTALAVVGGRLIASAPAEIAGQMEVRGIGIVPTPALPSAPVALAVDLDAAPERMPEPATRTFASVPIPLIALAGLEPSAPIKLEMALQRFGIAEP